MNLKRQLYAMRKRIPDKDLLSMQTIIGEEIDRRQINDKQASVK